MENLARIRADRCVFRQRCAVWLGSNWIGGPAGLQDVWPPVPSLDDVGPMARTLAAIRAIWAAMRRTDDRPPVAAPLHASFDPAWIADCDRKVQTAFARSLARLVDRGVRARCQSAGGKITSAGPHQ